MEPGPSPGDSPGNSGSRQTGTAGNGAEEAYSHQSWKKKFFFYVGKRKRNLFLTQYLKVGVKVKVNVLGLFW